MNIEVLKKEIIKNGGFTIDSEYKKINKKDGFMVSIYGMEKTYNINDINNIDGIIKEYKKIIENKKNVYIGAWLDNDIIYIDISKHYTSKKQAIKSGIDNKQLSIYDIKNNNSIELLKNVYIVYAYNKINNDIIYYKEFKTIKELEKSFAIKNAYQYICKDIENITTLLNDSYIIINDKIPYNEYMEI